jgi:hypothetical protein
MRESAELRIPEEHAKRFLAPDEGLSLGGTVRKLELNTASSRFSEIGIIDKKLRREGRALFTACRIRRRYSKAEIAAAELFHFRVTSVFEPAGEECGTKYDESAACPHCGAGARQITPLYLPEKRIPKSKDFSRTIAGEIVVSRRVFELFSRKGITGAELRPIHASPSSSAESPNWFQLLVSNEDVEVVSPTCVGTDPFDEDEKGEYRCPNGDLIGLNLLSEMFIKSASRGDADIISTRQFVGTRRGLLRPERIILISPKVRNLIISEKIKGIENEVAHVA